MAGAALRSESRLDVSIPQPIGGPGEAGKLKADPTASSSRTAWASPYLPPVMHGPDRVMVDVGVASIDGHQLRAAADGVTCRRLPFAGRCPLCRRLPLGFNVNNMAVLRSEGWLS
jgi:hypothetical protein